MPLKANERTRQLLVAAWLVLAGALVTALADPIDRAVGLVGIGIALAAGIMLDGRKVGGGIGMAVSILAAGLVGLGGGGLTSTVTVVASIALSALGVAVLRPASSSTSTVPTDADKAARPPSADLRLPPGVAGPELFERLATHELTRARRYERPLTHLLIGIEDWPRVVARHGRRGASGMVTSLAVRVRRVLRDVDALGIRDGGQLEVLLPETAIDGGRVVAGRIERAVLDDLGLVVRVGAATFPDDSATVEGLLHESEAALELATLERVEVVERTRLG